MTLDVIIATHNRCSLLKRALSSLLEATVPEGLRVSITVVDNNSSDETAFVVRDIASGAALPVRYVFEPRTGKAFAINTGITATNSELVGFIDDDEQVDSSWYTHVVEAFRDSSIDFIGGPYVPEWDVTAPSWLPHQAKGIIGWFEFGSTPKRYGTELPNANLAGGNAVIRRSTFDHVGLYRTDLGSHDDQEMFERLLARGAKGMYLPQLVIYHWIPRDRLQKRYFRDWTWRAGLKYARMQEINENLATVAGIPRYLFRAMLRALVQTGWQSMLVNHEKPRFEAELDLIYLISLTCGYFRLRGAQSSAHGPDLKSARNRSA